MAAIARSGRPEIGISEDARSVLYVLKSHTASPTTCESILARFKVNSGGGGQHRGTGLVNSWVAIRAKGF